MPAFIGSNDDTKSNWWRLRLRDGSTKEIFFCPKATRDDVLRGHKEAISAVSFEPKAKKPETDLSKADEQTIMVWVKSIGETDNAAIASIIKSCRNDAEARQYFLALATQV